jgi:NMD protein affecting ribosome stability and mRNA decay
MSDENMKKCHECGARAVRPLAKPGRMTKYRSMEMEIPAALEIPTCAECGTEWFDGPTDAALDAALEDTYQRRLKESLKADLETIFGTGISQANLERALGVSEGYISKLKREERNPGCELVVAVRLLATDPAKMVPKATDVFAREKERRHA